MGLGPSLTCALASAHLSFSAGTWARGSPMIRRVLVAPGPSRLFLVFASRGWAAFSSSPFLSPTRSSFGGSDRCGVGRSLNGRGGQGQVASHFLGLGWPPFGAAPVRASGVVQGSVGGLVRGAVPPSPLRSSPSFPTVPGEVPRDPALQVREPAAHPPRHLVLGGQSSQGRPGCLPLLRLPVPTPATAPSGPLPPPPSVLSV